VSSLRGLNQVHKSCSRMEVLYCTVYNVEFRKIPVGMRKTKKNPTQDSLYPG